MTPSQVSDQASKLRRDLIALSAIKIGMGNYQDVMRRYQLIVLGLIDCVRELSESVSSLSTDQRNVERELVKEKPNE